MIFRHRSPDDGEGAAAGTQAAEGAGGDLGNLNEGGNEGSNQGASQQMPDSPEGWKTFYEDKNKAWETEKGGLESKVQDLTKKIGKSANEAKAYQDLMSGLKSNPRSIIEKLASEHKVDLSAAAKTPDLSEILKGVSEGELDHTKAATLLMEHMNGVASQKAMEAVAPTLNTMLEADLAKRFPDYDDMADDRAGLEAEFAAGKLPRQELLHLATRGRNLASALKESEKVGYEKAVKEMTKKMQEQFGPGAPRVPAQSKEQQEEQKKNFGAALKAVSEA